MSFEDFPPSTGFQKIYNFRRLSHSRFYRCASVSFSTKADCKLLMNKYNIRTIVDLRGVGGMSSNIGPNNTLKFYPRLKDGNAKGEVNFLNGRLNGEEIFYNGNGDVVERNFWSNGRPALR